LDSAFYGALGEWGILLIVATLVLWIMSVVFQKFESAKPDSATKNNVPV
jgi:hypothetical protein